MVEPCSSSEIGVEANVVEQLLGPVITIVTFIGALFGLLASILAYVILYREYQHHFVDGARPRKMALQGALVTLLVFLALSITFGYAAQYFRIF